MCLEDIEWLMEIKHGQLLLLNLQKCLTGCLGILHGSRVAYGDLTRVVVRVKSP